MKVVEVVPLARGIKKDKLTYFTADDVKIGDFLEAPLRSRTIIARVISVADPKKIKANLKSSSFVLKKAKKLKNSNDLSAEFIESANQTADFFQTSLGAVLQSILPPKNIFNSLPQSSDISAKKKKESHDNLKSEISIHQASFNDRLASYKSLIREQFARNRSIFFILPTVSLAKIFFEEIKMGLESYAFILHSDLGKKDFLKNWRGAIEEPHPIIIVATPGFLFLPRDDFSILVLEEESSRFYKKNERPFVDFRFFVEKYAEKIDVRLIFADSMIETNIFSRFETGNISEFGKPSFRLMFQNEARINYFSVKRERPNDLFGDDFLKLLSGSISRQERLFVFVPRRGLSPITFCRDCQNPVRCPRCNSYLVLHEESKKDKDLRFFLCHRCNFEKSAKTRCDRCDSWNLKALYLGVDGVVAELKKLFPETPIFGISADSKKNNEKNLTDFQMTAGSVLVGTEMAIDILPIKPVNVSVLSVETLFSSPDYNSTESAIRLLINLRFLAEKRFLIQTAEEDNKFLLPVFSGNLLDFYQMELKERQTLKYPPYFVLLSILSPKNKKNEKIFNDLVFALEKYQPIIYNREIGRIKTLNLALRMKAEDYPNIEINQLISELPPDFEIEVNPKSFLR